MTAIRTAPPAGDARWSEGEATVRQAAARRNRVRLALLAAGWVSFLLVWELLSVYFSPNVLPSPRTVGAQMWEIVRSGLFVEHFFASVSKTFLGFGIAIAFAAPVGYLMGRSDYWRAFFQDGVTISGSIPSISYAVLALMVFGISTIGPMLTVALVAAPYIALNVSEGIRGVDKQLIDMSLAYKRSKNAIRRHVLIPSIVPFAFAAVRMSFAVAWKVEALTEVFGGRNGVGFQIKINYNLFNITGVLAWVFLFILFMAFIERVVLVRLENRLLAWRPGEQR